MSAARRQSAQPDSAKSIAFNDPGRTALARRARASVRSGATEGIPMRRSIVAVLLTVIGSRARIVLGLRGSSPSSSTPPTTLRALWSRTGIGDLVFDMPVDVARVHVTATYTGYASNFIEWIAGTRLLCNELLGTGWDRTTYDGTLLTGGGGGVSITNSSGVAWSFTEVR
jgi:hypothetical protein